MQNIEKVNEILYEEGHGIFSRLRNGDYSIFEEETNELISFAKDCNAELKKGSLRTEAVAILLEVVDIFSKNVKEERINLLLDTIMEEIYTGIEY